MSGNNSYVKSMNGIVSFDTGGSTIDGDVITIHKPFDKKVQLRMIKEGATDKILEGTTDPISVDQEATSEIFWLTKVLGDYDIKKVGDKFVFDNNGQSMILQRI